jgi:hypothetical protein
MERAVRKRIRWKACQVRGWRPPGDQPGNVQRIDGSDSFCERPELQ